MKNEPTNSPNKSSTKKVKTKQKMRIDWKMLYPIIGLLVFGALALIAFVSMGFGVNSNGKTVLGVDAGLLIPIGKLKSYNPTYGATISGIVIAWIVIIVPFAMMFWSPSRQMTKWIGIIPLVLTILAGALMFAGIGLFVRDFDTIKDLEQGYKINGGAIAGIVIIVLVGWLIAIAAITRGFFDFNFWTAKSELKPSKIVVNESKPTGSSSNPKLAETTHNATAKKPVVHQGSAEDEEEQTMTVSGFNRAVSSSDD